MLELRSDKTVEPTMKRLGGELKGIFRNDPIEVFVPVQNRDLDTFDMSTLQYVFVRSNNFQSLLRLRQVTGACGLVTKGESNRPSDAIPVDDEYVQGLVHDAEEEHRKRAVGIEVGSFVRILQGQTRDFCGTVEIVGDGKAVVKITLLTKYIMLETPIRNLLKLPDVPANKRVYYFGPLVNDLSPEELSLIEQDLHLDDSMPVEVMEEQQAEEPKRHSRQRTVTALVKKLVLLEGLHNPLEIARVVLEALKNDEIKAPKNLFIIYGIIKDRLMKDYFLVKDPEVKTYRDVIHKYGKAYKFSANQIAKLDAAINIPINTSEPADEVVVVEKKQRGPKKRRKLPHDKCNTCYHTREQHKPTPKGSWGRCSGISDHTIHSWVKPGTSNPCTCVRFKERAVK